MGFKKTSELSKLDPYIANDRSKEEREERSTLLRDIKQLKSYGVDIKIRNYNKILLNNKSISKGKMNNLL